MFGNKMDAKKKAIDELMSHLDQRDGMDLGDAMKPKGVDVEADKAEGTPGEEASESPEMEASEGMDGGKPELSEEQIQELIEALQSKLG